MRRIIIGLSLALLLGVISTGRVYAIMGNNQTLPGGPLPKLIITSMKHERLGSREVFDITIKNTGNNTLNPTGTMIIKNPLGVIASIQNVAMGMLLEPGATAKI